MKQCAIATKGGVLCRLTNLPKILTPHCTLFHGSVLEGTMSCDADMSTPRHKRHAVCALHEIPAIKLGCKFRRNSGRNSQIPFRFGDFASGTTEYLYESSGFLRCLFIMSLSRTGRFARPPHCEACLGPSERAYLSLFGLRDSQRRCFRGS